MREVTIQRGGECEVFVVGYDMKCPLCLTLVRSGEFHRCRIDTPQKRRTPRHQQPHKGAK